ncbi:PDR/VanB family oxidoreductase [Agromyces mangrovi Wang et al. 2018]|uniref:PDR/VanB family oxidoreductase n=1 Tax=Agromyces mangrovi TaxID=1858653 RepID=UPI002572DB03|nr:PDR/VanB family oxidoreductase [Agromyces mangrovi]BDZ63805.1 ferredoxin [Agromyces mangrovi]
MDAAPEFDVVVRRRTDPVDRVAVVELARVGGLPFPAWRPGAHVDLLASDDLVRQYSLCGDPADDGAWRIAVLREEDGRGGSAWAHEHLVDGAAVRARGPWNHFAMTDAPAYRFIAGGIGITPLLPMLAAAEASGTPWTLDYCGRSASGLAFLDELAGFGERVRVHASDAAGRMDLATVAPEPGELVFACGPHGLLDELEARSASWAPGTLHVERFEAREQGEPVLHESFEVELAASGVTVTVPPERSILDVIEEETDAFVISSCREGTCGTCETPVLEGEVDHRDSILTHEEQGANDRMMICCSRSACPKLVLDL